MKYLFLLFVSCGPVTARHVSHAANPVGGIETHSCKNGVICDEGYACPYCEWCGSDDGVPTRCTEGND